MFDDGHQNDPAPLSISITTTAYAVWVAISGELDSSNHHHLEHALAGLCLAGVGHVHLRLSDLRFCDVAGMRQLLSFTRRTQLTGRRVSTHGTSRNLRRLCHLMTDGKVSLDRPVWERARRNSTGIGPLPLPGNALTP
jgi:anti-anti-sigma factor